MTYKTDQENFWAGDFGNDYVDRNSDESKQVSKQASKQSLLASRIAFITKVFQKAHRPESVLELGSNIGLNLMAINNLIPDILLHGVEINEKASKILQKYLDENAKAGSNVFNESILEFEADRKYDLTISSGVMIHINPNKLNDFYRRLYEFSNRYILVSEYYNPTPVEVSYRGHKERLFKRDFAGELMDKYKDLDLLDYGFIYHRDKIFPQDDATWFLLEKR